MRDIACGMREAGLFAFASAVNAAHMGRWPELGLYDEGVEGWGEAFRQAVTRTLAASGRIHFNLSGLDISEALRGDPEMWTDRYTAWELQQLIRNEDWLNATVFYLNGEILENDQLTKFGIVSA